MLVLISLARSMIRALYLTDFIFHDKYSGSIGMQCPPSPGPGRKRMNPKGLVLAASMTSHTSRPRRSHISTISLTMAMLTARKVFSSSLVISATSADETRTTLSIAPSYNAAATAVQAGVMPPMTLGVFLVVQSERPG